MIYTADNTAMVGRPATVKVNGVLIGLCVRAITFGPLIAAEALRTYTDGTPIVFGDVLATKWVFGFGRVELMELA